MKCESLYLLVLTLPLVSSLIIGMWGNKIGSKGVSIVGVIPMWMCMVIALYGWYEVGLNNSVVYIVLWDWIVSDMYNVEIGLIYDSLSSVMVVLITVVSSMVLLYSSEYMRYDISYSRYMLYINMFGFSMILLIVSNNLLSMFVGYEFVGIVSYLLINYWYTSVENNKSAVQAVLVNKVGDAMIVLAIALLYNEFKTVSYDVILSMSSMSSKVGWICLLLLIGAMSKSAQVGLHVWLANAMAAPTPVSALLHAATMVTAGVFILVRMSGMIEYSGIIRDVITVVGATTVLVAGTIGIVQNDIKKVIAYSTGSQLGYMVMSCGVSGYTIGLFHLVTHGCFKALLFLSAGVVIHGMNNVQCMRKYGGLIKVLPLAYSSVLIGTVALLGLPYLSGYYSKHGIMLYMMNIAWGGSIVGIYGTIVGMIGAFSTGFYSIRLMSLVFISKPASNKVIAENVKESGWRMSIPLIILSVLSIFVGSLLSDMMIGAGSSYWNNSVIVLEKNELVVEYEYLSWVVKLVPTIVSVLGLVIAVKLYRDSGIDMLYKVKRSKWGVKVFRLWTKKYYFDKLYNEVVVQNVMKWSYDVTYKYVDKGVLEVYGGEGISKGWLWLGNKQMKLQTGNVYNYMLVIVIGMISLLLFVVKWYVM